MAVTKIWTIKDSLSRVIQYAENPDKTGLSGLAQALHYAEDEAKTSMEKEEVYLVTGIKCRTQTAAEDMLVVQQRFGKTDKTVALHAYQSFKPGEVSPQLCHEIGAELAQKLWGNRYQVVVATHMNTDCCHNHFVINSVSFVDGKKFQQKKQQYYELRDASDALCEKHGLSVIKNPDGRTPRQIYWAEKRGEPTRYNLMRQAIDDAVAKSFSLNDFIKHLLRNGYQIEQNPSRKYATIQRVGEARVTRLYQLGEGYDSIAAITKRLEENTPEQAFRQFHKQEKHPLTPFSLKLVLGSDRKVGGLYGLYLHYCYLLGILPKGNQQKPLSPQMREEVRKLDKIILQLDLLQQNRIETMEELHTFMAEKSNHLQMLEKQRQQLRNSLRWKKTPATIDEVKDKISLLTAAIKPMRQAIKTAEAIEENSIKAAERVKQEEAFRDSIRKRTEQNRGSRW